MSSSTSAEEKAQASPTSSESESPSSTMKWDSFGRFITNRWNKVRMADHLRLMQDNQRLLDTATVAERAQRQQQYELRQAQVDQARQSIQPASNDMATKPLEFPAEEMGDISIDSPVTTHHHYPPTQPAPAPAPAAQPRRLGPWTGAVLTAAALGGLAAAGLGGAALTHYLAKPSQDTATTTTQPGTVTPAAPVEGYDVTRERQSDGTMKATERVPVRYKDGVREITGPKEIMQPDGTWKKE